MDLLHTLVDEYRNVNAVAPWSDAEKAAGRSMIRGVASRMGIYREFIAELEDPANVVKMDSWRDEAHKSA